MSPIYFGGEAVAVAFIFLPAITFALDLIAHMLMYVAAIRFRHAKPKLARTLKFPA